MLSLLEAHNVTDAIPLLEHLGYKYCHEPAKITSESGSHGGELVAASKCLVRVRVRNKQITILTEPRQKGCVRALN